MRRPPVGGAIAATLLALLLPAAGCNDTIRRPERVVLVTWDTTRADRLGAYGYEAARTPHIDALTQEGVLFENAVSPVPTTLPSHSTMFTGLYPHDHKVRYNLQFRLSDKLETLAERLSTAGFATAGFPASHILDAKYGLAQGFDTWIAPPAITERDGQHPESIMRSAGDGVDDVIEWLEQTGDRRSFVWLHFYDPHYPYLLPFPYDSEYRDRPYDGELAYTDAQFGRLVKALKDDPRWDDTLLIVAGDHGEGLHEHRERWHSLLVYEGTQHVPLIVKSPGGDRGRRVSEPVTLADVSPTILDLVGIPATDPMRGISLRGSLSGGSPPPRDLYFESLAGTLNYGWQELVGIRFGNWKLIQSETPELFDLGSDPGELRDLSFTEPARLQELQTQLGKIQVEILDIEEVDVSEELSPEEVELMNSLGYTAGGTGQSVEGAPHPKDVVDLQIELLGAQAMVAQQDWARVEEFVGYVLKRDPRNKWAMINRATALLRQGKPVEGEAAAAEAYKTHPDDPAVHGLMAQLLSANGRYADAFKTLQLAVAREGFADQARLRYLLLVTGFEAERDDVCSELVPDSVIAFPASGLINMMKARCLARDGDATGALQRLKLAAGFGFRDLQVLKDAPDFASVIALDEYAAFAASIENPDGEDDDDAEDEDAG